MIELPIEIVREVHMPKDFCDDANTLRFLIRRTDLNRDCGNEMAVDFDAPLTALMQDDSGSRDGVPNEVDPADSRRDTAVGSSNQSDTGLFEATRKHVLVVEDDPLVRNTVKSLLGSLGHQVTATATGPEALEVLGNTDTIDVLLTDVILPGGMNGLEVAVQASALQPGIPTVFVSGYPQDILANVGQLDDDVVLLAKPFTRRQIAQALAQAG